MKNSIKKAAILFQEKYFRQLLRYGIVGIVQNSVGYSVYLFITWFGVPPKIAVSCLYFLGVLISFLENKTYTFSYIDSVQLALLKFFVAHIGGYLLNIILMIIFVDKLNYPHQVVQAVAIFVVAVYLFFMLKFFVFSQKSKIPRPYVPNRV